MQELWEDRHRSETSQDTQKESFTGTNVCIMIQLVKDLLILLPANYEVYFPLGYTGYAVLEFEGTLSKCLLRKVHRQEKGFPYIKLPKVEEGQWADYYIAADSAAQTLWMLPEVDVLGQQTIRLSDRWEHCIIAGHFNKTHSKQTRQGIDRKGLKAAALEAIENRKLE